MKTSTPTFAAAILLTAVATPVFAQAAIQEPGAYSFYHPNADVLAGRQGYRPKFLHVRDRRMVYSLPICGRVSIDAAVLPGYPGVRLEVDQNRVAEGLGESRAAREGSGSAPSLVPARRLSDGPRLRSRRRGPSTSTPER